MNTIITQLKNLIIKLKNTFGQSKRDQSAPLSFRIKYERYREILNANDSLLKFIANLEDKLSGRGPFAVTPYIQKIKQSCLDAFVMCKNLNQLAADRYHELYDVLEYLSKNIATVLEENPSDVDRDPLIIPLSKLRASDADLAGKKMASLGEIKNAIGLNVPEGFVITTTGFIRFLLEHDIGKQTGQLEEILESLGQQALGEACQEIQKALMSLTIPHNLEQAILTSHETYCQDHQVAMRSSAIGEDSAISCAGQYSTVLNVSKAGLLNAYRTVISSVYQPSAVIYRFERGLLAKDALMAVGCIHMLKPVCSGVMFSRDFSDPAADRVIISVTQGLADALVSGSESAQEIIVTDSDYGSSSCLSKDDQKRLFETARNLESYFGQPQDVEWAIEEDGKLYILQSRPMVPVMSPAQAIEPIVISKDPLLQGGATACPGMAAGPAFICRDFHELMHFPEGGVLISRHASPKLSRVMPGCAAIVTEIGSVNSHMAIISREFNIPTIVGLSEACRVIVNGVMITVNADACKVYEGDLCGGLSMRAIKPSLANSPAVGFLKKAARFITPLNLTDPESPDFSPSGCKSIHDIMRFVHEKVFDVMFHFSQDAQDDHIPYQLDVHLPLRLRILDVGDGLNKKEAGRTLIKPSDIASLPMQALLEGMLDNRIQWNKPRPISTSGMLSVMTESMMAPPEASQLARDSYCLISAQYMNFNTKMGYHFSTIDSYCGLSKNKNYIHFHFSGGGASQERRLRRVRFLSHVLDHLDFEVQIRNDLIVARMEKCEQAVISKRLTELGRLTLCARQLDMLMDHDSSPDFFEKAFIADEIEKFF